MAPIIPFIGLIGSAVGAIGGGGRQQQQYQYPQQVYQAPPPPPVIVKPAQVQPQFTSDAATRVANQAANQQSQFFNSEMAALTKRAQEQGVTAASIGATQDEGQKWLASDQADRATLLQLNAEVSQQQADYANAVNNQNFQTQVDAMTQYPNVRPQVVNAVPLQPSSQPGVGDLLGTVLGSVMGNPNQNQVYPGTSPTTIDPNTYTGQSVYANPSGVIMPPVDYTSATMNSVSDSPDTFGLFGGGD